MSDKQLATGVKAKHLTLSGLKQRGWTDGMVHTLLGSPDERARNPRYQGASPVRLYAVKRIEAAERAVDFADVAERAARRSAAAKAVADRRREIVLRHIATADLPVPDIEPDLLARRAVRHRDERTPKRERTRLSEVDPLTLERWKVDYLRHQLTDYDHFLDGLFGLTGKAEATRLLRIRVYAAIGKAYPGLAAECRRQLASRS